MDPKTTDTQKSKLTEDNDGDKITNYQYSMYTKDGLIKSTTKYYPMDTHDQQAMGNIKREDLSKPSLYEYTTIQKWSDIIALSAKCIP